MPDELVVPAPFLFSFLAVVARLSGAVLFLPIPAFRGAAPAPKIILVLSLAIVLLPCWPAVSLPSAGADAAGLLVRLAVLAAAEAAFGACAGIAIALINETFVLGVQILSMQAGYSYASFIDPQTQADSGVLPVLAQLLGSLLFLALGLDRQVLAAFAESLKSVPPGSFVLPGPWGAKLIAASGGMLELAMRLALPIVALLFLVDLALSLLGRIDNQMQLLTLAFPAKMLISMFVLAAAIPLFPSLYTLAARRAFDLLVGLVAPGG